MKYLNFIFLLSSFLCFGQAPDELYQKNQTFTYEGITKAYRELGALYPEKCQLKEIGLSDAGLPIHLFILNKEGGFETKDFTKKAVVFINNAIHPGEPCGVDASYKLSKDLLLNGLPDNVVIAIIPMYNVGGALNRNCCSRANQNGPEMYGFRGNAKNLDLNRDFIKADSKNTLAFYKAFHFLKPHLFIDTHTSNGADYQHVMTLITSQTDKMHPYLKEFSKAKINPFLFKGMEESGYPMMPYMNHVKETPDDGIADYLETPRYSTGYTNLFNCLSYVSEAHMLKTYKQRVESTYTLLGLFIQFAENNTKELLDLKKKADYNLGHTQKLPLNWEMDTLTYTEIKFMGYAAKYKKSEVTGEDRLYYDRDEPFTKNIKYFNSYCAKDCVIVPSFYIIPQAWDVLIPLFQANQVDVYRLTSDLVELPSEKYRITEFSATKSPYEGHYLHSKIKVETISGEMNWRKGDYVIPTRNFNLRFIVETLEPQAVDSYLAWNYFDAVLQQKEWFSAYVFEDEAAQILADNPVLNQTFLDRKNSDPEFAESTFLQLYFLFQNSGHYELTHNLYPVGRIMDELINADQIQKVE